MERRTHYRNKTRSGGRQAQGSQSVARALTILDFFGKATEELGVREIARRMAVSASIVQRLVGTLASFGYLEQSPVSRRYRIGYKAFQVGNAYLSGSDVSETSLPELRAMADRDGLNTFLGVLREGAVVYLATIQAAGPIAIRNAPGSRTFLHSTALGKALLAGLTDAEVGALLGPQPYHRLTAKTKTRLQPLLADLRSVRALGYSISDGENLENVISIGAPLRDISGSTVAAISGALPRNHVRPDDIAAICRKMSEAAMRISRRLGAPLPINGPYVQAVS
jgi:DNA-binding IclR family transcriptional regulator